MRNVDVYVTGRNARFLLKDMITEFHGRGDELHMYPLSFAEYMSVYQESKRDGWNEYMLCGGLPQNLCFFALKNTAKHRNTVCQTRTVGHLPFARRCIKSTFFKILIL